MDRRVSIIVSSGLVGLGAFLVAWQLQLRGFSAQSLGFSAPRRTFTARLQQELVGVGVPTRTRNLFYAVRSDGSKVEGTSRVYPDGRLYITRAVSLAPEGKYVVVSEATESKTTWPLSLRAVAELKSGPSDPSCTVKADGPRQFRVIGSGTLLEYVVVKLEVERGLVRTEEWEAPALGCYPMKVVYEWKDTNGNIESRTDTTVTSITLGDPDPGLFAVPGTYAEVPPSRMNMEGAMRLFGHVPQCLIDQAPKADRLYRPPDK